MVPVAASDGCERDQADVARPRRKRARRAKEVRGSRRLRPRGGSQPLRPCAAPFTPLGADGAAAAGEAASPPLSAEAAASEAAAALADDEADRAVQRVRAELLRLARPPPGGGGGKQGATPAFVAPAPPPEGAKVWRTRCSGCTHELSSDAFSNGQRRLLKRGVAALCKPCLHATTPSGKAELAKAAAAKTLAEAEASESPVTAEARAAALERVRQRRAARDAGRAAAAAAVVSDEDAPPVFFALHVEWTASAGPYACFSNSFEAEVSDDLGRVFANGEQQLQHCKAGSFGDVARCALIQGEPDAARVRELGRLVAPFDGARWARYRSAFCDDVLWRKFRAYPRFAATLLATGGRLLVGCSEDAVWGVGASDDECRAMSSAELERRREGGNLLGEALMRVRARLRRAKAIAEHTAALPWQCDPVNGGIDWELFADVLECFAAATCLREREAVCSRTGAKWDDLGLIDVLRRIPLEGGVPASAEAVAELDAGGVDRVAGRNGSMGLEEVMASFRLLQAELEAGHLEMFLERAAMGPDPIWVHPVSLVTKNKDGSHKFKSAVDLVLGIVRDGQYGADLQPAFRWIDNHSAGKVPALTPDGRRSKSKPAQDSLNAFSPLSVPCTLDDVPYIANLIMALKTDGGRLTGGAKRRVQGSAIDISNAYRNVCLRRDHRRLFCFRFLDVTKPIPRYVLDGGQPREEDLVFYRKTVMPFGWVGSVDTWVRISKAVKALHMWDDCPGVKARVPRKQRPDGSWAPQHASAIYLDDLGAFGVVDEKGTNWADVSQARYIELCGMLGIPISLEKLAAEGDVGDVVAMLGVLMDCPEEQLRLSPARLEMLAKRCREVQGKAYVTKKELRNLVGILSFAASCAPAGRTFMRRLYDAQKHKGKFCRINRGLKCDLSWWISFVLEDGGWHGVSMLIEDFVTTAEELGLFTDASLEGFGATFVLPDGTCEFFSGRWGDVLPGIDTSQETGTWHISELELLVQVMAMQQWSSHLTQRRIISRCDNESAVHAINSGRARDPAMSLLLRELWLTKARGSFEMQAKHVKTHDNVLGDNPSRWTRDDGARDAAVEAEFFAHLAAHYGVAKRDAVEVEVAADTEGLLRRMRKAHAGAVHRLHEPDGAPVVRARGSPPPLVCCRRPAPPPPP